MKRLILPVFALVLVVSLIGCSRQNTEGGRPVAGGNSSEGRNWGKPERPSFKIPVTVEPVNRGRMAEYLQAVGTVVPVRELEIKPEMTGRIYYTKRWMEGDEVKEGEILAAIDDRQLRIDIRDAELNLATARAAVNPASAELAQAIKDEEYRRQMLTRGAVSVAEVEQFTLQRIQRENQYKQALSTVTSREMALDRMEQELEKVQILAPFDGVLLPAESGTTSLQREGNEADLTTLNEQMVSQGQVVCRIANIDEVYVALDIPAKDLLDIEIGQKVELEIYSRVESDYIGTVDDISTTLNASTRTYTVNVLVENPLNELRPGMFAKARIVTEEKRDAISIPRELVMLRNNQQVVFVAIEKPSPDNIIQDEESVEPVEVGSRQLTMAGSSDSITGTAAASGEEGEGEEELTPDEQEILNRLEEMEAENEPEPEKEWIAEQRVVTTGIENREMIEIVDGLAAGDLLVVLGYETLTDEVPINVTIRNPETTALTGAMN